MTAARAMRERKARRYLRSRMRARRPLSWAVVVAIVVMRDCRRVFFDGMGGARGGEGRGLDVGGCAPGLQIWESERKRGDKDVAENHLSKCNNQFSTTYTSNESINIHHLHYQQRKSKERHTNCRRIEREEMRNRTHPAVGKRRKTTYHDISSLPVTAISYPFTDARRIFKLSYTRTYISYHKPTVTVALSRHEER